ncbi:Outer membrane TonB-dependent transporter, utilization system for glycans and polysaccharides (PUL), SusC family [Bacteroides ovatus]|nr:Outer membrane TonB-dependent transporter, utilization system for glycans and polysaccharides (PUL), SusC family [Bacteroides ovatus]
MKSNPSANLSNALAGNVAGVLAMQTSGQPGVNTSEFWIRGISTFGANSAALVLVDGFERDLR